MFVISKLQKKIYVCYVSEIPSINESFIHMFESRACKNDAGKNSKK